jgi:hypothetical protein
LADPATASQKVTAPAVKAAEETVETSTVLVLALKVRTTFQDAISRFSLAKTTRLASVSARPTPFKPQRNSREVYADGPHR